MQKRLSVSAFEIHQIEILIIYLLHNLIDNMTNLELAEHFSELGKLMELHQDNPFKIRTYQRTSQTLKKMTDEVSEMSPEQIASIKGFGSAVQDKIRQLNETGQMSTLEKWRAKTPNGIREMIFVRGLGPKKIYTLWKELGIESIGELLYAINENRLIELKGFGLKTQKSLKEKLQYYYSQKDKFRFATIEPQAETLLNELNQINGTKTSFCGQIRRKMPVVEGIEILVSSDFDLNLLATIPDLSDIEMEELFVRAVFKEHYPVKITAARPDLFYTDLVKTTGSSRFANIAVNILEAASEEEVLNASGLPIWPPELREDIHQDVQFDTSSLISEAEIAGVIHNHSTYSDGIDSLSVLAEYCRAQGFAYLGITDHSKSAVYANGLTIDRLEEQWSEIEKLNQNWNDFKIFKGIESDILSDGSLDYDNNVLEKFDFVVASVHSVLNMDIERATNRLIKAIENPYTSILGHPSGRLLLARPGYPLDYTKIIDACAANGVSIELNANPYRLDLDWTHIPEAQEKGVLISINPDAHSRRGVQHIKYGVLAARKGGLTKDMCLNTKSLEAFGDWCKNRR